jgi:hypothetical protein
VNCHFSIVWERCPAQGLEARPESVQLKRGPKSGIFAKGFYSNDFDEPDPAFLPILGTNNQSAHDGPQKISERVLSLSGT